MDILSANALPWLHPWQRLLRDSRSAGRLPHSTLLLSTPGLGAEHLADWLAAATLCQATPALAPCGACPSCMLLRSNSHPDYHLVKLEDEAKQIKVDQVRELIDALSLKSYRGGYKVGVIEGAEALNTNGANAFLKTLEEPSADTLLVMIARPTHRLPATIASRCLRIALRPPTTAAALAWLAAHGPAGQDFTAALVLAGGAPLLALELQEAGIAALEAAMLADLKALAAGAVDVTLLADQWVRSNLPLRMTWLENWITCRVHTSLGAGNLTQTAGRVRLPGALLKPKIRPLFELLDAIRELRRLASTGMNQQLALEALLLGGSGAWAS
jgi:DNA polymerase-3 subunit delta'